MMPMPHKRDEFDSNKSNLRLVAPRAVYHCDLFLLPK